MEQYWILTCEHASNAVPECYRKLFAQKKRLLETHRSYDIGAQHYARTLARRLLSPLFCGHCTRLLVDLNRSSDNPHLLSSITKSLDASSRQEILSRYYLPYRSKVRQLVQKKVASGVRVVHVSCHSFTPILGKVERKTDLGILYDPNRGLEKSLALSMREKLRAETSMRIRLNAPYKGVSDGHVTALRKLFSEEQYVGIELEVNQSLYVPIKSPLWQHVWLPRLVEVLRFSALSKE